MSRAPIVILRSNDVCFLGIVRGCATAGIEPIVVTFTWPGAGPWHSDHSRHISQRFEIPNPYQFAEGARDAMVEIGRELSARYGERLVVLGSSDTNLMFLFDHRDELAPYFRFMGDRALDRGQPDILHKARCGERLGAAGVSIPLTRGCASADEIERVCEEMIYPCVYKPAVKDYGQAFYAAHDGNKAISIESSVDLAAALEREIEAGFDLVVQERVEFESADDEIPFYLYADGSGEIRIAATAIKELIQPYPFGTANILRLSYHPELLVHARAVVGALAYRGILMIEFIRDRKDGAWKVIELNPRPWLFVDFFRRNGLNYLAALADDRDGVFDDRSLQTPIQTEPTTTPVHISLPPASRPDLEKLGRPPQVGDVSAWLSRVAGKRSLTFLDPDDPAPGRAELEAMAATWSLDSAALLAAVSEVLCDE